jgi:hypothetical protein
MQSKFEKIGTENLRVSKKISFSEKNFRKKCNFASISFLWNPRSVFVRNGTDGVAVQVTIESGSTESKAHVQEHSPMG